MGGVWLRLRAELRRQWRGWLALAALLGVMAGIALTTAAGAWRTDTAYPRFLHRSHAADLLVSPARSGFHGYFRAVARLPQVAAADAVAFLQMSRPGPGASPFSDLVAEASPFGGEGVAINRVRVVAGRIFSPADPRAVMISRKLAAREHLQPGSTLHLIGYPQRGGNPGAGPAVRLSFRVSAIVVFDDEIVPANKELAEPRVLLSPAFARGGQAQSFNPAGGGSYVVLRPGADAATFASQAAALARRYGVGDVQVVHLATEYAATQRAIRPEAVALAIFATLTSLIALAVVGQLLSRQLILDSAEFPILRALGMSRSRLAVLSLARVAIVTTAGAVVAVAAAIAASPLMPIGPARFAEPSPGIDVNLPVLGAGFAITAVVPLLVLAPAAVRAATRPPGPLGVAEPAAPIRPARLAPALGLAGSVPGSLGVRMALEPGHGRTAVPVRSALVGTAAAVAAVVAALVFGTSFLWLVGTPHRYGQNWAQQLDLQVGSIPVTMGQRVLRRVTGLTGYAGGNYGQVSVAALGSGGRSGSGRGTAVPAIGIDQLHGRGFLTMLTGQAPAGPHQIALGPRSLHTLGLHVGQRVMVSAHGRAAMMRVAGSAVFAAFSVGGGSATDLGTGAAVSASVLSQPNPPACVGGVTCYNFFLLRYQPGTDLPAAANRLRAAVTRAGCPPGLCLVTTDQRPSDIRDYTGVRDTPLVLGALLGMLAVGMLSHALLAGVRRRYRDLALLKTLGLVRSQLLRVVCWQASTLAAVAVLAGLPLGVLAGRWAWVVFAGSAGVAGQADVPVPLVLLAIPATLLLANLIAAGPGWTAARVPAATVLRGE
ncbi:MAG: putative transport system permease protein [Streptosporangiaceae bacterium]|nr:putative transport system permease protein [Streptosporangiaceae bacterium]